MNEPQAIRLCLRHQDPVGFEFLVTKYRREAFSHAMGLLGNQEDAADACQESFRRAFAAIPKLAALDQFYPWFYRILRNCCLNMLSRRKTARDYAKENQSAGIATSLSADPAAILAEQEEQRVVRQALNSLDPEVREILSLKYIQGHSYEEIARLLEIPRGTVMSRLFYARKAFRKKYMEINKPARNQREGERHE